MKVEAIQNIGALAMVAGAMLAVAWLALNGNEPSQGALIGVVSAGVGFFLRGKVERAG